MLLKGFLDADISAEILFFLATVRSGVMFTLIYEGLLFLRALVHHGTAWRDAEDILFFIFAGFSFFLVIYRYNFGMVRWYAFAGLLFGIVVSGKILNVLLEPVRKWLLQKREKAYKIKRTKAAVRRAEKKSGGCREACRTYRERKGTGVCR